MRWMAGLVLAALAALAPCPAGADTWEYGRDEDPFNGDLHVAFVASDDDAYGFGLFCRDDTDLRLLYLTNDAPPSGLALDILLRRDFEILVLVDDRPPIALSAKAELSPQGDEIAFRSARLYASDAAIAILNAKRRVAVGVKHRKDIFDTAVLSAENAYVALALLLLRCGFPPPYRN